MVPQIWEIRFLLLLFILRSNLTQACFRRFEIWKYVEFKSILIRTWIWMCLKVCYIKSQGCVTVSWVSERMIVMILIKRSMWLDPGIYREVIRVKQRTLGLWILFDVLRRLNENQTSAGRSRSNIKQGCSCWCKFFAYCNVRYFGTWFFNLCL